MPSRPEAKGQARRRRSRTRARRPRTCRLHPAASRRGPPGRSLGFSSLPSRPRRSRCCRERAGDCCQKCQPRMLRPSLWLN
ncbi:MAG: hypothetical protein DUD33_04210 [Coriobacteriaceae bacterium]|nr:MAG: hypothetical protein DUD33_04210 [Coriobacteriaceae bacterium]